MASLGDRETSDCYLDGDKAPLREVNEQANRERAQRLLAQVEAAMNLAERRRSARDIFNSVCTKYLSAEEIASMGKSLMLPREGLIESLDVYGFGISSTTDSRWRTHKKDLIERFEKFFFVWHLDRSFKQITFTQWSSALNAFITAPYSDEVLDLLFETLDHDNNGYLMEDDIARLILIQDRIDYSLHSTTADIDEPEKMDLEPLMKVAVRLLKTADCRERDGQLSFDEFADFYTNRSHKSLTGRIGSRHKDLLKYANRYWNSGMLDRERVHKRVDQVKALGDRQTSDLSLDGDEESGMEDTPREENEDANRDRAQKLLEQVRASMNFEERKRPAKDVFSSVCRKYLSDYEIASMGEDLMLPREGLIESLDVYGFGISTDPKWRTHKEDLVKKFEKFFDYDSDLGVEQISFTQWSVALGVFITYPCQEGVLSLLFETLDHDNNDFLMEEDIARLILIQDRISHSLGLVDPDSEPVTMNLQQVMTVSLQLLTDADCVITDGQLSMKEFIDFYTARQSKRLTGAIRSTHKLLLEKANRNTKSGRLGIERVNKRVDRVRASGTFDMTGIAEDIADA